MTEILSREQMLTSFCQLENGFDQTLTQANNLDQTLESTLSRFQQRMAQQAQQAKTGLSRNNPLQTQLTEITSALEQTERNWQQSMAKYDKGLAFRQHVQDSLLVFVYGKVKSGKSSLGNYIAWGCTEPNSVHKQQARLDLQPAYFTEANTQAANGDADNEAKHNRQFRVGATETTSSIQGFRLPGLTWVDSPGLHSATEQNGQLAQEYVQHADLIIYTMSSNAPGRASDLAELYALKAQGKRVLILLTQSDTAEEDENALGEIIRTPVMKTADIRQKQRAYIMAQCQDAGFELDHNDLISVSANYAELHPEHPDKMQDSGMTALFQRMDQISQQEGVQLKRTAPLRNYYHYLSACEAELKPYQRLLTDFDAEIGKLERSVPKIMLRHSRQAEQQLRAAIERTFNAELEPLRGDEQAVNRALNAAVSDWDAEQKAAVLLALEQGLAQINDDLAQAADQAWQHTELALPPFVIDTVHKEVTVSYSGGTRRRNSGLGALLLGAAGVLIAGPLAGALLATGGSLFGHASGRDASVNRETVALQVGDNLETLKKQISDRYCEVLAQQIDQGSQRLLTDAITSIRAVTAQFASEVNELQNQINALKAQAEASLSQGAK